MQCPKCDANEWSDYKAEGPEKWWRVLIDFASAFPGGTPTSDTMNDVLMKCRKCGKVVVYKPSA